MRIISSQIEFLRPTADPLFKVTFLKTSGFE